MWKPSIFRSQHYFQPFKKLLRKIPHNRLLPFQNTATSKKILDSDEDDEEDAAEDKIKKRGRVSEAGGTVISSSDEDDDKVRGRHLLSKA